MERAKRRHDKVWHIKTSTAGVMLCGEFINASMLVNRVNDYGGLHCVRCEQAHIIEGDKHRAPTDVIRGGR